MADVADNAQDMADEYLRRGLERIRGIEDEEAVGTDYCIDCDMKIPDGRKKVRPNCCRCVRCQDLFERAAEKRC